MSDIVISGSSLPVVVPLASGISLRAAFERLWTLPHCVWFDSALRLDRLGRYSFLTADPYDWLAVDAGAADPLAGLAARLRFFDQPGAPGLPPFQGGAAGVLSYDLGASLEAIASHRHHDFPTPWMCVGLYDWTLAVDHRSERGWIISQGWPESEPERRRRRALRRVAQVRQWLNEPPAAPPSGAERRIAAADLAPQFPTGRPGISSNFAPEDFRAAIAEVTAAIRRGDVFQVNLAQRLLAAWGGSPAELYLAMRDINPAPFAGYFDAGDWQLVGASPERFLQVESRHVETRPIKGTVPRTGDPDRDAELGRRLLASEKDRAENVMIVDLMRNDLSRVCHDDSVRVTELCALEPYAHVQHLVSAVAGELLPDASPVDLLRATFPGGSITGAPKVQAMKMIARLEPTPRGPYCGALGYFSTGGRCDSNILIRNMIAHGGWLQIPVGGGVTARSTPAAEEQETWQKAEGMLRALELSAVNH